MDRGLVSSRGRNLKPTCVPLKHRSSPTDFLYPLCLAATSTICGSPILFPFSRISQPPHPSSLALVLLRRPLLTDSLASFFSDSSISHCSWPGLESCG